MNKLTFTLSGLQNAGQVADLRKDFNIYAKSQQNILVNVLVPKSLIGAEITNQYFDTDGSMVCENGIYTALKMGMVFMRNDGKIGKTQSYYLRYIKTIVNRFGEFYLYERLLPREFTRVAGVGVNAPKFVFNVVNIANNIVVDEHGETIVNEPTVVSLFTTQICRLDVLPSTELDQDPEAEASEFDLLSAEVNFLLAQSQNNSIKAETVLRYDISLELPESVVYNANGYKTVGTMFQNVSFEIPTLDYGIETKIGSLLVSNIRQENDLFIQTEIFFYDNGIAERVIKLENDYSVNTVGGWEIKINRKQDASHIGDFLHVDANGNLAFTRAIKDFIITQNNQTLTENASHFDFSNLFQIVANGEDVQIDVVDAIKNAFNNAVLDGKKLRFTKVNSNTLEISLPSKLSEYENDTHFIDKSVNNLENYTKTENVGNKLALSIDPQTYVLTISLLNSADQVLSSKTVDLPLETMVVSGSYSNGVLRLTLQSGQHIDIPISSLISGLVPETRKINGKPLSDDINLTASDVGAVAKTTDGNKIYATNLSGEQVLLGYTPGVATGNVVTRTTGGNINVPQTPNDDGSATSKKYVDDKVKTPISGATNPTTSTIGFLGQLYLNTTNNCTFQCVEITPQGTDPETYTYTWIKLIRETDKASINDYGVVEIAQGRGLDFLSDGRLYVDVAGDAQITNRTIGRPIATSSLNFAVKSALTDNNRLAMTPSEQDIAQEVLGISISKLTIDSSLVLTNDQITLLRQNPCVLTNDVQLPTFTFNRGTIFLVPFEYANSLRGIAIYNNKITTYYINLNNNTIGEGGTDIAITKVASLNGKGLPNYPNDNKTYDFQQVNGSLSWIEHQNHAFKVMPAPSSTTLTDAQISDIIGGAVIEEAFQNRTKMTFFPGSKDNYNLNYNGMFIGKDSGTSSYIGYYKINVSSKVLTLTNLVQIADDKVYSISNLLNVNGKAIPSYPSDTSKDYYLKQNKTNGNLSWVDASEMVSTEPQTLTETQKAQARQNIGAGSANATMVLVDDVPQSSMSFDSDPQQQITANTNERHSHSNKTLLDTYSQTEANLADAVSKKHEHSNKSLLDTYAQTETDLADAVTKKHEHSNKSVLDGITSQKVSEWDGKQNALTFDNTPTSNSANPVTSGGVKAALDSKADVEIIDIGNTRIVTNAGSIPDISYATMQSILTALNSAKSVLLQWNFTSPAIYFKVLGWASSGSSYIRIFTSVSTSVQYYISNNAVAYLVGSHADKLGNNTFSGTNNFTGTFQIGGATISYDSATDTFTV